MEYSVESVSKQCSISLSLNWFQSKRSTSESNQASWQLRLIRMKNKHQLIGSLNSVVYKIPAVCIIVYLFLKFDKIKYLLFQNCCVFLSNQAQTLPFQLLADLRSDWHSQIVLLAQTSRAYLLVNQDSHQHVNSFLHIISWQLFAARSFISSGNETQVLRWRSVPDNVSEMATEYFFNVYAY